MGFWWNCEQRWWNIFFPRLRAVRLNFLVIIGDSYGDYWENNYQNRINRVFTKLMMVRTTYKNFHILFVSSIFYEHRLFFCGTLHFWTNRPIKTLACFLVQFSKMSWCCPFEEVKFGLPDPKRDQVRNWQPIKNPHSHTLFSFLSEVKLSPRKGKSRIRSQNTGQIET